MGAFLLVLKIIGIVLLCVLLFVLCLILLLLFIPYRYKIKADNINSIEGKFTFSWFLHIIHAVVSYNNEEKINLRIYVFGIKIYDKLKKASKEERKRLKNNSKNYDNTDDSFEDISQTECKTISPISNGVASSSKDDFDKIQTENKQLNIASDIEASLSDDKPKKKVKHRFSILILFDKLSELILRFSYFLLILPEKIESAFRKPEEAVEKLADKYIYYSNLFSKNATHDVIEFVKKNIIRLIKHILPSKIYFSSEYGSNDPEKVAKIMEIYGLLNPFLPKGIYIKPGFDANYFRFNADIKGHFYLIYILIIGLKCFFNKKLRKFIKLLKRS